MLSRQLMKLSAMRLSTRMKTERAITEVVGALHCVYLSCKMSRLERLICERMRPKSSWRTQRRGGGRQEAGRGVRVALGRRRLRAACGRAHGLVCCVTSGGSSHVSRRVASFACRSS